MFSETHEDCNAEFPFLIIEMENTWYGYSIWDTPIKDAKMDVENYKNRTESSETTSVY